MPSFALSLLLGSLLVGCGGSGSATSSDGGGPAPSEVDTEAGSFGVRSLGDVEQPVIVSGPNATSIGLAGQIRRIRYNNVSPLPLREDIAFLDRTVLTAGLDLKVRTIDGRFNGTLARGLEPAEIQWNSNGTAIYGVVAGEPGTLFSRSVFEFPLNGSAPIERFSGITGPFAVAPDNATIFAVRESGDNQLLQRAVVGVSGPVTVLTKKRIFAVDIGGQNPNACYFSFENTDGSFGFGRIAITGGSPGSVGRTKPILAMGIGRRRFPVSGVSATTSDLIYYMEPSGTPVTPSNVVQLGRLNPNNPAIEELGTVTNVSGGPVSSIQVASQIDRACLSTASTSVISQIGGSFTSPVFNLSTGAFPHLFARNNTAIPVLDGAAGLVGNESNIRAAIVTTAQSDTGVPTLASSVVARTINNGGLRVSAADGASGAAQLVFTISVVDVADNIFRMRNINGIYGAPGEITLATGVPWKQALVILNGTTGEVNSIIALDSNRSASSFVREGDDIVLKEGVLAAWGAKGEKLALSGLGIRISNSPRSVSP